MNTIHLSGQFNLQTAPAARRRLVGMLKFLDMHDSDQIVAIDMAG